MGCSIYRWRKHTATSSNPKGAVMAAGVEEDPREWRS